VQIAGDHLSLQVVDDGKGFEVSNHNALAGFGLFNINERISNQGGRMEILSAPGQGTRVIITFPLLEDLPSCV